MKGSFYIHKWSLDVCSTTFGQRKISRILQVLEIFKI